MSAMEEALRELVALNGAVTSEIIKDLIEEHAPKAARMKKLYERYKASAEGVPILTRTFDDPTKVNNRINNSFDSDIVDTKVGYFMGYPVYYGYEQDAPNAEEAEKIIQDFNTYNNYENIDAETAKWQAICGLMPRLFWIDKDGRERMMKFNPWEVIFVYDRSIEELQYALRYYPITVKKGGVTVELTRVEWYDNKNVTYYIETEKGEFVPDDTEPVNPQPHLFDYVPIVAFPNNDEMMGDAERVLALIDAYDGRFSDSANDLEQFASAYMLFYGSTPTPEVMAAAKRLGAFGLDENDKVEFLTKDLSGTVEAKENFLDRAEENILRFAKSVNFTDDSFSGNVSGVAMKYKLFGLETKCRYTELKFRAALRQQFRILASSWNKKKLNIDPEKVFFTFKRNIPANILEEAQTTAALKGLVSEETRLSKLSFVDDVRYEIERMQEEAAAMVDLDEPINGE